MKILAVIPARGGSKRLPRKNVKQLKGKPLISWTIESAVQCRLIDKVVVSTDCQKIASIALNSGAEVPFIRPQHLSEDNSSSVDVVRHTLDYFKGEGEEYDLVILLQPTSPLRNQQHIVKAIELFREKGADGVVSVCECEHSPLWANSLPGSLSMDEFIQPKVQGLRSQDLPTFYRLNGAIYLVSVSRFYSENSVFLSSNTYAYIMDSLSSVDIDHEHDFLLAEAILTIEEKNE